MAFSIACKYFLGDPKPRGVIGLLSLLCRWGIYPPCLVPLLIYSTVRLMVITNVSIWLVKILINVALRDFLFLVSK